MAVNGLGLTAVQPEAHCSVEVAGLRQRVNNHFAGLGAACGEGTAVGIRESGQCKAEAAGELVPPQAEDRRLSRRADGVALWSRMGGLDGRGELATDLDDAGGAPSPGNGRHKEPGGAVPRHGNN